MGFTFSPEGRSFVLAQLEKESLGGSKPAGGDYAAQLLLYSGSGPVAPRPSALAGVTVIGKNDAVVVRNAPWEWAFSSYATKPIQSRWIQDRQNFFDLFYAGLGLVAGGGNTKLQPYWSTFTVGDPSVLKHREGDEDPNFIPKVDLLWAADHAEIAASGNPTRLNLRYGEIECSVSVEVRPGEHAAVLTYKAPRGKKVEAHLPFMKLADALKTAKGAELALGEEDFVIGEGNIGGSFDFGRVHVEIPAGASLRWVCRQHNPYTKDGHSELADAKLVLAMPFDGADTYRVLISVRS